MAGEIDPKTVWATPFGEALLDVAATIEGETRVAVKRMQRKAETSAKFRDLCLKSASRYIFRPPPGTRFANIAAGRLFPEPAEVNDAGFVVVNGRATRRRAIGMFHTFGEWRFTPHPDTDFTMSQGDTIRLRRRDLLEGDAGINYFIARAAHEMQHALTRIKVIADKGGPPTLLNDAEADGAGEAEARETEMLVLRQLRDPRGRRREATTVAQQIELLNDGSKTPNIARSFRSGIHMLTYAEEWIVNHIKTAQLRSRAFNARELAGLHDEIDTLLDRPSSPRLTPLLQELSDPLRTRDDYAEVLAALGLFAGDPTAEAIYMDAAVLHLIERVIDHRWLAFLAEFTGSPDYFAALEARAREHAALLLGGIDGVTFEMLYGPPFQTTPLTDR